MQSITEKTYTYEEYLELSQVSEQRLEYHVGKVYAMAGGTAKHTILCGNINRRLAERLDDSDCIVYTSDMQLAIENINRYVYPDTMVTCGEQEFTNERETQLKNPTLIVEVLSKSTKDYDRTNKFAYYRTLPSFKEYILIHSDSITVETFYKAESNYWKIATYFSLDDIVKINAFDIEIPMIQIYQKIKGLTNSNP